MTLKKNKTNHSIILGSVFFMKVTNGKNIHSNSQLSLSSYSFFLALKKAKQNKNILNPPIRIVLIKTKPNSLIPTPPSHRQQYLFRKQY